MKDCIFCKIVSGEIPSEKIYENDSFFSILDQNQDIKGHALIISKDHFENTLDLPSSSGSDFLYCVKETALKVMGKQDAKGFNLIGNNFSAAQQAVMHFHAHIIPRKAGDGLNVLE